MVGTNASYGVGATLGGPSSGGFQQSLVANVEKRGYAPRVLRYFLMSAHYRAPMNFTFQALDGAKALQIFDRFWRKDDLISHFWL